MADPLARQESGARRLLLPALRALFAVAVVVFAWLGLRGRWDEIGTALQSMSVGGFIGAVVLVCAGLMATGVLWLRLMSMLDAPLPAVPGFATFFIGQLGKYIPGSVWSLGAQADLARRYAAPPRVTVAAGLVFLGYHVVTGAIVAAGVILIGQLDVDWPDWLTVLALVVALIGGLPLVVRFLASKLGGRSLRLGWRDTAVVVVLMAVAWSAYASAMVLIMPGSPWDGWLTLGGAFAAAYVAGVVIVFAPAGAGAREFTFVLLLEPALGVASATALILVARVVHTISDALMALGWWLAARSRRETRRGTRRGT